jgi:hypothetical protein
MVGRLARSGSQFARVQAGPCRRSNGSHPQSNGTCPREARDLHCLPSGVSCLTVSDLGPTVGRVTPKVVNADLSVALAGSGNMVIPHGERSRPSSWGHVCDPAPFRPPPILGSRCSPAVGRADSVSRRHPGNPSTGPRPRLRGSRSSWSGRAGFRWSIRIEWLIRDQPWSRGDGRCQCSASLRRPCHRWGRGCHGRWVRRPDADRYGSTTG